MHYTKVQETNAFYMKHLYNYKITLNLQRDINGVIFKLKDEGQTYVNTITPTYPSDCFYRAREKVKRRFC